MSNCINFFVNACCLTGLITSEWFICVSDKRPNISFVISLILIRYVDRINVSAGNVYKPSKYINIYVFLLSPAYRWQRTAFPARPDIIMGVKVQRDL